MPPREIACRLSVSSKRRVDTGTNPAGVIPFMWEHLHGHSCCVAEWHSESTDHNLEHELYTVDHGPSVLARPAKRKPVDFAPKISNSRELSLVTRRIPRQDVDKMSCGVSRLRGNE